MSGFCGGCEKDDGVLAHCSRPYMSFLSGLRIFELPYRFRGVYVLVIDPFVI